MPPKKKLKRASIKRDFLAALPTSLTSTSTPLDLAPDLLLRAYGLAGPRPGNKDEQLHRVCANRWTKEALKEHKQVRAPEVLVLDSDDSDEDPVRSLGSSKGKGKAVAKEVCCLEACGGNPRCLNWLGQDKWENTGESTLFSLVGGQQLPAGCWRYIELIRECGLQSQRSRCSRTRRGSATILRTNEIRMCQLDSR